MGTTESNVDHAASGQTVAGDSGELTFTYAQGRFASEGKDWESPVVTNMAASVSADAGNAPAGSITNTGTNNTFTSTTESSLATLLLSRPPFSRAMAKTPFANVTHSPARCCASSTKPAPC